MGMKNYIRRAARGLALKAILLTAAAAVCLEASAQQAKVRFPDSSISIYDGFKEISRQAGMRFVVNLSKYDYGQMVGVPREATVTEAMDALLAGSGKTYQINEKHILIVDNDKGSGAAPQAVQSPDGYKPSEQVNAEFDGSLRDFRAQGEAAANKPAKTELRETVVEQIVEGRRDGIFTYSPVDRNITLTGADVRSQSSFRELPRFALKTNLAYWAAAGTINLGAEFGVGDKSSIEVMLAYNPWNLKGSYEDNKKLVHRTAKAEYRWWLCERFNGHFFGAHAFFTNYNISQYNIPIVGFKKDYRYQGYAVGAGVSYGYHLMLSGHWGLEFNAGVGLAYMNYEKKDCIKCGALVGNYEKMYFGPTSLGIKILFVIK